MSRIVVIGNSGGGKSALARSLARRRGLRYIEIDQLLWQAGWKLTPADIYMRQHSELIAQEQWVIDGLGQLASIPDRLSRATDVILVDMPLWVHFWLAAERQIAWINGTLEHPPAGMSQAPPMRDLFKTIWDVDQTWMPNIRAMCKDVEAHGKPVLWLRCVQDLDAFIHAITQRQSGAASKGAN